MGNVGKQKVKVGFSFNLETREALDKNFPEIAMHFRYRTVSELVEDVLLAFTYDYDEQKDKIEVRPGKPVRWRVKFE